MRKRYILLGVPIAVLVVFFVMFFSSKNTNTEVEKYNLKTYTQLERLNLNSILLYQQCLYRNDGYLSKNSVTSENKLPLEYGISTFDVDLMPMMVSDKIIICQTHSIKVYYNNSVYEYTCGGQIKSITLPYSIGSTLIVYAIVVDKALDLNAISEETNNPKLYKICFTGAEFLEELVCELDIPDSLMIRQAYSEINFFTLSDNVIKFVLTDSHYESAIYKFDVTAGTLEKLFDGIIIIPNNHAKNHLWYVSKLNSEECVLMKDSQIVCPINQYITQGYFIADTIIELFYWDASRLTEFDFINGPGVPHYSSDLFFLNEKRNIQCNYRELFHWPSLFDYKKDRDNILIVFPCG